MLFVAIGALTNLDKVGPFVDEEMRVLNELRNEGRVRAALRRKHEPGVFLVVDADNVEDAKVQLDRLPYVGAGVLKFELIEVGEI
jgi:uncharacterized protein YciI